MKKPIKILAIILLCVYAVIATTAATLATKSESNLISKNEQLVSLYKELENEYSKLEIEYDELESEHIELKSELLSEHYNRLAFEIITIDAADESRDFEAVFNDIAMRENLGVYDRMYVSQRITSILSVYNK